MDLALNYSHPAAGLFRSGQITFDYFKCPNWPHLITEAAAYRPVAVHFNFQAGQLNNAPRDFDQAQALLDLTGTRFINLHMISTTEDFPGISPDHPEPAQSAQILAAIRRDVERTAAYFGTEKVIVENVPSHSRLGQVLRPAIEPENIYRIVEETGCGLLLDISHARISARHLGWDEHAYMDALPVHRLRELHFTGLDWVDGSLQDHYPVRPEDWPELDWALERIRSGRWARPALLAFEYGGVGGPFENRSDPQVIAEQVPLLLEQVKPI